MSPEIIRLILQSTADTLVMVAVAAGIGTLLGLPLGVFLATSRRGELFAAPAVNAVLGVLVNATRSTPFIILVVAIIPFTRLIAGTSIGTTAAIVPLTVADIVQNPKKLKIVEVEAAQTARSLQDVAAAAINTNYAVDAKIEPTSAILREDPKGPYVNLIAVRAADKDKPWVKALLESYHSPEIKQFVAERFKGSVLASW